MSSPDSPACYLDHAATTPMFPEAIETMTRMLAQGGNASSLHTSGRGARRVVEESRERIAERVGARPSEVVFTSGGTEADNLAVKGLFWARRRDDRRRTRVIASAIEHHALLDPLVWLRTHEAADADLVDPDHAGRIDLDALAAAVRTDPETVALLSCMWANNEVGTVQPISGLVELAHTYAIPVHSDAVQAAGHLPLDFAASGLDAMTITAHKLGGPVGVGALVVRRELELVPVLHGGGQEREVRSGTLDMPAIAAFATAVDLAFERQAAEYARLDALRTRLVEGIRAAIPDAIVNGDGEPGPEHRLPGIAHLTFPGCDGDALLMLLDAQGIECSTGSACSAGVPEASHVLLAMGADEPLARGSLRFSLGHTSTERDVDRVVEALPAMYERARAASLSGMR